MARIHRGSLLLGLCALTWGCLPGSQPVGMADTGTETAASTGRGPDSTSDLSASDTGPIGGTGSTGSSGSTSGTATLDGTSTGADVDPCDVCGASELCVQHYNQKNCIFCDDWTEPPYVIECLARRPDACDEALTHDRACTLALCGIPDAPSFGCGCADEESDFLCGVTLNPESLCDFWGELVRECGPEESKCIPVRDERLQILPHTSCDYLLREPAIPVGEPCEVQLYDDLCEPTAFCDEGVCRPLCIGSEAMPTCAAPDETCELFVEGQPQFGGVCRPA